MTRLPSLLSVAGCLSIASCIFAACCFVLPSANAQDKSAQDKAVDKTAAPAKPGVALEGYRFEFPCADPMPDEPKAGADGLSGLVKGGDPAKTDQFTSKKEFGGAT